MNRTNDARSVIIVTAMFPTAKRPFFGIAVAREVAALRNAGVSVSVVSKPPGIRGYLVLAFRLLRQATGNRDLVIHAHYGTAGFVAACLRPLIRRPMVLTLHGSDITYRRRPPLKYWMQAQLSCLASFQFSAVIVQARFMRDLLPRKVRPRTVVLPQAISGSFWAEEHADDRSGVLFLADAERPVKRFPLAQEVARRALQVHTLPSLDDYDVVDIAPTMRQFRWGLMTSDSEGMPVAVREAILSGLHVFAITLPGLEELKELFPDMLTLATSGESLGEALATAADTGAAPKASTQLMIHQRGRDLGWDSHTHVQRLLAFYDLAASAVAKEER